MTSSVRQTTLDSSDPYALGGFWAQVLDGSLQDDDLPEHDEVLVTHAGTPLLLVRVPEAKAVKNRMHLDLQPRTTQAEEVARLQGLGARVVDDRRTPEGRGWVVMADPEGNEFCVERSAAERGEQPVDTGSRAMPQGIHGADERTMLTQMLDWYREGVLRKVDGLAQPEAVRSPLRSGTSVAALVKHLALVEDSWFTERFAGRPAPEPWASAPWDDDRDWEFTSAASEPLEDSVALYRAACARSREVVADRALDDTMTERGRTVSLRFVLLHLVEETARHLGHLDVLCELADGRTGE